MTADDLWQMPRGQQRYELLRGELRTMTPAGFEHGVIEMRIGYLLMQYVDRHALGVVVPGDTGFIIARNPDTVRAPDVGFVRQDRIPDPRPVKYWVGAPDLAVEINSPSDIASKVDEKAKGWIDAGSSEVVVIDPKLKVVKVLRPGGVEIVLHSGDAIENLQSVPGFRCAVDEIFV